MKVLFWGLGLLCVGVFSVQTASAATLYLSPTQVELNRGDSTKLSLRLDVDEDECVNAIDGVLSYTENIEPIDISRGASIMSIWVEEPVINRDARTITFAGGIPNGYCGRIVGDPRLTNNIIDVVFQSPGFVIGGGTGTSSSMARVEVAEDTQVYLNDGFGTRTNVNRYGADLTLATTVGSTIENPWGEIIAADEQAPEAFSIMLERTKSAFDNDWFITFNTTDKQTGIDHYEVMEEPLKDFWSFRWGEVTAPWIEARSPYVLEDQSLNATIRVRAIDKAGNEYLAVLVPPEAQRTMTMNALLVYAAITAGIISVLIIVGGILLVRSRRRALRNAPLGTDEAMTDEEEVFEDEEDEENEEETVSSVTK
jgi:hypothetical protein